MRTKEEYQEALDEIEGMLIEYDYVDGRKVSANPIMVVQVALLQELIDNSDKQYEKGMSDGLDMVISIVQQLRVRK